MLFSVCIYGKEQKAPGREKRGKKSKKGRIQYEKFLFDSVLKTNRSRSPPGCLKFVSIFPDFNRDNASLFAPCRPEGFPLNMEGHPYRQREVVSAGKPWLSAKHQHRFVTNSNLFFNERFSISRVSSFDPSRLVTVSRPALLHAQVRSIRP